MPVVPSSIHSFQDCKTLAQYLRSIQHKNLETRDAQFVAIAFDLDPTDPLAVLQTMVRPGEAHFYLEKPGEQDAIAAFGTVESRTSSGQFRFAEVQEFIQSCEVYTGGISTQRSPRFLCSFTFFADESQSEHDPAPAMAFLPAWQVVRQADQSWAIACITLHAYSKTEDISQRVWQQFQSIQSVKHRVIHFPTAFNPAFHQWQISDVNDFRATVASALDSMRQKRLDKLVLSHAVDVVSPLPFNWIQSLQQLRHSHPDCFIFSTHNGTGKTFIGASPERLIRVQNGRFLTEALAGSAPRGSTPEADADHGDRLLSSQKERHEHQLVADFLCDRLTHLGITPQSATMPQLFKLSNIQHLQTPIWGTVPAHLHPLDLLAELHPTPAVAGMPRDLACAEIRRYEPFGRSRYAAPLGWVDAQGNAEFVVGIRSAELEGNRARLYAGAGIVAGSDPDRELAEVKLKLQALLKALV
ncbi:isochorismate synthase [Leptolyngbya sp. AN02str]|uniref:isochorismate synthase n=1 Tax=Leptolyngbya sp. AN02str TaxID=3423363 RepID=UPI003D30F539